MKKKIVNVTYRKDSNTFPDWLKYEITILNDEGKEEVVPAYGKDLEDAISRIKHDERVNKFEKTTSRIHPIFFLALWVIFMYGVVTLHYKLEDPLVILYGLIFAGVSIIFLQRWSQYRNVDRR
jgi:hypothetical protein